jgi:pyruvate formate lyase activating enzyme
MSDKSTNMKIISKREFLRQCAFCTGGLALGALHPNLFSLASGNDLGKFSKEALFYTRTADGLQCDKCPQGCLLINDGDVGFCRNRVMNSGKIYTIAYGNPCAVHVDPVEKKPFFHFLPGTHAFSIAAAGCNFRCLNCQNWQISQVSPKESDNVDLMPEEVINACLNAGSESIAYTYSEPTTFYEYAYDTAKLARNKKIRKM